MTRETCTECEAETGRAGRHEDSLYAGDHGPYCEDCWGELPDKMAHSIDVMAKALRDVIGMLDDPTGAEHVRDMRGATLIARKALAEATA